MDLINHSLQNVENAENTENIKNLIGGGNKSTKPLNFTLYRSTYGTRLVYFRRPNIPVSSISMHVNLGSRMEKDGDHGISHLLEHLVFKGSKNYPLMNHISIIVDSSGGYFNAYTSQRQTAYYVNIPDESLKEVIPVLSDMLLYPLLRTEDILGEKHIVKSELNKRMDNEIAFLNVALI